jgi:hypothetical protein
MSYKLPYTNADVRCNDMKHALFNDCVTHVRKCMWTSAKLLCGSIAACIHGIIPRAFKYTALSVCLSIVEDDLQTNCVHLPNHINISLDEEKME